MENTLENKAKFFAQYFGQEVRIWQLAPKETWNVSYTSLSIESIQASFLNLKPLSSITDEDAGLIAKHYEESAHDIQISSGQIVFDFYYGDIIQSAAIDFSLDYCVDYLRSKGYAVHYMGLSVEKQIEYGWVKLS